MHTKCPKCKALFRIQLEQFQQAQGRVRCGQCNTLFDAKNNIVLPRSRKMLTDLEAPTDAQSRERRFATSHHPPLENLVSEQEQIPVPKLIPESNKGTSRQHGDAKRTIMQTSSGTLTASNTEFVTETNLSPRRGAITMVLGSIALVLLLLTQILYFHRDQLSKQPLLAGLILEACDMLGCIIEPIRDIDRIEVINRNVFSHPSVAKALMITATFANVASFPQPYPIMQVSLTDLQGKIVAARRFLPNEYLRNTNKSSTLMKPGVPVDVSVEVLDPQNGAMAFEFAFLDL